MKRFFLSAIIYGIFSIASAEVTVICNTNLEIKKDEVKEVFMGEKKSVGGVKLALSDNKSILKEFSLRALGMDGAKYEALWAKKSFRDGTPTPKAKVSDNEVIDFVKSTPGGVGYISSSTKPTGVNIVGKF